MNIEFFNDDYNLTPQEYAKVMFENTNEGFLILSRRNEDPFSDEYDKQRFEIFTMNWDETDLEDVISDFEVLYSELKSGLKVYDSDSIIEGLELFLESKMVKCRVIRVCKLIELGAPDYIISFEACKLIDAMIIARYAVSMDYNFELAKDFKVA